MHITIRDDRGILIYEFSGDVEAETSSQKAHRLRRLRRQEEADQILGRDTDPRTYQGRINRLPESSEARKEIPLVTGLLDYFPDALAAVAFVSKRGNDKHNPGEPLHWSREKSNDHSDCIGRHLIDRGGFDKDGIRHSAYLAWRALALLQEEMEAANGLPKSRGSQ